MTHCISIDTNRVRFHTTISYPWCPWSCFMVNIHMRIGRLSGKSISPFESLHRDASVCLSLLVLLVQPAQSCYPYGYRGLSSNGTKNNGKKMRRLVEPIEVYAPA